MKKSITDNKSHIKIYSELINLTGDILSASIISEIIDEEIKLNNAKSCDLFVSTWKCRSEFNWNERLMISTKKIDSRIKKLKTLDLIETKLFKVKEAPLLHIRLKTENTKIKAVLASLSHEHPASNLELPISNKSDARDFSLMGESTSNSRSIKYTPTKAMHEPLAQKTLKDRQRMVLGELEQTPLPWEKKINLLKPDFSPEEILILSYLEDCPLTVEQKLQLFAFSAEHVLQAIKRTKQSKIKKTFMHCLMHACIHKLGPYLSTEQLEEEIHQEKCSEIQKNKELAISLEKLVEGTPLQGCLKAHEYHLYYDLSYFDPRENSPQNIAYLDKEFNCAIKFVYKLCVSRIPKSENNRKQSHLSLKTEEITKKTISSLKEKKHSKNFRVCV